MPAGTLARVPPLVVHGFRNASDAELSYLNLHAPGVGFADYLRALRDGRPLTYDQEPPPADGGRPASAAVVGGDGYTAERPGVRAELLADVDEIAIAEVTSEPDRPSSPPHVHRRHVESFYVLDGELALTAAGREVRAPVGSWVQLAPGVPHTDPRPGPDRVRFLNVHSPSRGFGAFLRALGDAGDEEIAVARAPFDQEPSPA